MHDHENEALGAEAEPEQREREERDRGQGWELVYQARSREHDWLASWLDHDRFRSATFRYAWEHYRTPRQQFADWVAKQASAAFPDASRVRVSFVRYRTRSPAEVKRGTPAQEKRELSQIRSLQAQAAR